MKCSAEDDITSRAGLLDGGYETSDYLVVMTTIRSQTTKQTGKVDSGTKVCRVMLCSDRLFVIT